MVRQVSIEGYVARDRFHTMGSIFQYAS